MPNVIHLCFGYAAVARGEKPTGYPFLSQLSASVVNEISIEAAQPNVDLGVLSALSNKRIMLGSSTSVATRWKPSTQSPSASAMDCGT